MRLGYDVPIWNVIVRLHCYSVYLERPVENRLTSFELLVVVSRIVPFGKNNVCGGKANFLGCLAVLFFSPVGVRVGETNRHEKGND